MLRVSNVSGQELAEPFYRVPADAGQNVPQIRLGLSIIGFCGANECCQKLTFPSSDAQKLVPLLCVVG
jgi:hypothetical protein